MTINTPSESRKERFSRLSRRQKPPKQRLRISWKRNDPNLHPLVTVKATSRNSRREFYLGDFDGIVEPEFDYFHPVLVHPNPTGPSPDKMANLVTITTVVLRRNPGVFFHF